MLNRLNRKPFLALAVASVTAAAMGQTALGISWSSAATTDTWATGTNWVGGSAPTAATIAEFDQTSYAGTGNAPNAGTASVLGVQFGDGTTGAAPITISGTQLSIGSSGVVMMANSGASGISSPITLSSDQTWSNASANLLTVGPGILTGAGFSLTVNSTAAGGITLSGAQGPTVAAVKNFTVTNSGSGTITDSTGYVVGTGTMTVTNTGTGAISFPTGAGGSGGIEGFTDLSFSNAGTGAGSVTIIPTSITGGFFASGINSLTLSNTNSGTGGLTFSGNLFGAGTGALNVTNTTANHNVLTFSSNINGFNAINVTVGTGDLITFGGEYAPTNTGTTTIMGGGTLVMAPVSAALAATQAGGTAGTLVVSGTLKGSLFANSFIPLGTVTLGGSGTTGTIDLNGLGNQIGGLADGAGVPATTEFVTNSNATAAVLTVNTTTGNSTFGGIIQNGTGTVGLTKSGLNTLNLTGVNTYTGATQGTEGTLNFVGQATSGTQTLGLLTVGSGGLVLQSTYGAGASGTNILKFSNSGAFTHTAGATIDFVISGGSATTNEIQLGTSTLSAFIGPWATYGTGSSTQYATIIASGGVNVVGNFTTGIGITGPDSLPTATTTNNYELTQGGTYTLSANRFANTLRYTGTAQTIALNGNNLNLNGVMNVGSGTLTFANSSGVGSVLPLGAELDVNAASGDIEFNAPINYTSATSQGITITGTNKVSFNTINSTGASGVLTIYNGSQGTGALVIGSSQALVLNNSSTVATSTLVIKAPIVDNALGASSVTINGTSVGGVTLNGANTFTGGLFLNAGSTLNLFATGDGSALGLGVFTINGGTINTNSNTFIDTATQFMHWNGNFATTGSAGASNMGSSTFGTVTLGGSITATIASSMTIGSITDAGNGFGLTKAGTATLFISGFNSFTGPLTITGGTVQTNLNFALNQSNVVQIGTSGTLSTNQALLFIAGLSDAPGGGKGGTVTLYAHPIDIMGAGNYTFTGTIVNGAAAGNITMAGSGTETLGGTNTATNTVSVLSGTLNLDFSSTVVPAPASNILYNGVAAQIMTMGGGTLMLTGKASTTNSQTLASLSMTTGGSSIDLVSAASNPLVLSFGAMTRPVGTIGGTLNIILPSGVQSASNGVVTTQANTANIIGGYATVTDTDTNWATNLGGNIVALNAAGAPGYTSALPLATGASTGNYMQAPATLNETDTLTANTSYNTIKITPGSTGQSLNLGGKTLTMTSGGGLLMTGANDYTITGGTMAGTETIIQQYAANNNLTISAVISGNALTKSGPGTLTLSGANSYTGVTTLNGGVVNINSFNSGAGNFSSLGVGTLNTGIAIVFNGGALQYGFTPTLPSQDITTRPITINAGGMVIDTNGHDVTFANAFGGGVSASGQTRNVPGGFTKNGAGTLTIANIATYAGPTVINGGVLSIGTTPTIAGGVIAQTSLNGSGASGGLAITVASTSGLFVGQTVTTTSNLLSPGTVITSIPNSTTVLVSAGVGGFGAQNFSSTAPVAVIFGGFSALNDGGPLNSSSLGLSTYAAENLIINGGTLQYTGVSTTTNRLFTIGSNGGTIDASGSGTMTFTNTQPLVFGGGTPTLTLTGSNTGNNTLNPTIGNGPSGVTSVAKSGAGTWVLAGANTYTGNTTIGWTSALVPNGGTLKLGGASNNIAGSPIITVGTKAGDGSVLDVTGITGGFTLGAAQTLAGHGTVNGAVATVSSNHVSPGNGAGVVGTLTFSTGLTLAGGVNLDYDFGPALAGHTFVTGSSDSVAVTGAAGSLNFTAPVTLNLATGSANFTGSGSYELFSYTTAGAVGTFTPGDGVTGSIVLGSSFSSLSGDTFTIANDVTAQGIFLDFAPISSGVPAGNGTWHNGSGDGKWTTNTASGSNWNTGIPNAADQVATFDDSANGGAGTVDLDGDKTVGGINLFTASAGYTIGLPSTTNTLNFQTTTGDAAINVTGAGSHTINALSNLVNTTDVSVAAGGSLNMVGAVSGAGALTLTGGGTLTLSSAAGNSYGGGTTVNGGTLIVSNTSGGSATGTGDVTLNGGTLGGGGSITGNVIAGSGLHTIAPSAGLSPTSTTNLTVGGLTTSTNTTLSFNLNGGVVSDLGVSDTITAGTVTLNGGNIVIANNSATGAGSLGYYKLISYTTLLGTGAANLTLSAPAGGTGVVYTLDTTHAGSIDVHRGFLGDANDDGVVNFSDFVALSNHFGSTVAGWSGGDFNADGVVNFSDFVALSNHFGATILPTSESVSDSEVAEFDAASSSFFGSSSVPEPTSLALLGLGAVALLKRRRKA